MTPIKKSEEQLVGKMLLTRNILFSQGVLSDASTLAHYKGFGDEVECERLFRDLLWK